MSFIYCLYSVIYRQFYKLKRSQELFCILLQIVKAQRTHAHNVTAMSVYLDYNATTPLAAEVLEVTTAALRDAWANPNSSHEAGEARDPSLPPQPLSIVVICIGQRAHRCIEKARSQVANMINSSAEGLPLVSVSVTNARADVFSG